MMVYIEVHTTDPAFNLALEEYVFTKMPRDREYFLTWQNENAIIIGRHQNARAEINGDFVREKNIRVVRRLSGGGAVYHDLGNLNFTFITNAQPGQKVDLRKFCQPVADVLSSFGVDAVVDGRNDILVDGKKVSGNAQYVQKGRVMHHGTLLFDADTSVLAQALRPDPTKILAKGVKSVRSRVTNIRPCLRQDMTMAEFRETLTNALLSGDFVRYDLTEEDLQAVEQIRDARYGLTEWNYGFCEEQDLIRRRRIPDCGVVEAHIRLDEDRIAGLTFYGDYFSTRPTEELCRELIHTRLAPAELEKTLAEHEVSDYITGLTRENLVALLCDLPEYRFCD